MLSLLSGAAMLLGVSNADTYMHMPKGSNDRLNEQAAARNNENRLFNSQNNNRGGYNVGDLDPENGFDGADYIASATEMYDFRFLSAAGTLEKQYEMLYFEGSQISVTWTNQHGAGSAKENTEMILQFVCDTLPRASEANNQQGFGPSASLSGFSNGAVTAQMAARMRQHGLRVELYNGGNTDTPDKPNALTSNEITTNYQNNMNNERGRRESEEYYALCNARSRNKGLFTADQQLQGTTQIYTRQNPGGTRYGLECQEERDHYPWWNPSPFHDVAIITADVQWCQDNVAPESQNVKAKYQCVTNGITPSTTLDSWLPSETAVKANLDPEACAAAGHLWDGFSWNGQQPECVNSYYARDNHLGNVDGTKRGGRMASYDWWVPMVDDLNTQHYCYKYTYDIDDRTESTVDADTQIECVRMMFRLRYNMSTMNFDPFNTDSRMNQDNNKGVISPIEQNPTVDVGAYAQGLRLAINTAQTGRTFQDNSHTFLVCKRPDSDWQEKTVFNINVRGKRGNIVQTFPAIEYDFEPQIAFIRPDECMHFQWEGSNTHNNGNPGGDGQTGDAGEGRGGSDRSNLLQALGLDDSYPLTYDKISPTFFEYVTCYHPLFPGTAVSSQDCQLTLGSAGFYRSVTDAQSQTNADDKLLDYLLNNVSGAFRQGIVVCANGDALEDSNDVKEFNFISTRNNNFSNRSQKLKIVITADPEDENYW